jgi:hypothetical protein
MPRTTRDGLLSLAVNVDGTPPSIELPNDEAAFRYGLCAHRDWGPFVHSQEKPKPGIAIDMRPSDKGRYLTASLRRAESIDRASEIFLNGFWRQQFEHLGATPKATDERIKIVTATLKKRLRPKTHQRENYGT